MTNEEWLECQNYFRDKNGNLRCAYCNKVIEAATVEHFIPIAKGGTLTKENVLPVCLSCNTSKQDKDFFEWYPQQEFYSKERKRKNIGIFRLQSKSTIKHPLKGAFIMVQKKVIKF